MLPSKNDEYLGPDFWQQRYATNSEKIREWLGDYSLFDDYFRQNVQKSSSILILGCGNSLLSEQLFKDGYENIHNIDISSNVIEKMRKHCEICKQMKWSAMDCQNLKFPPDSFDVIIEKATLDVFLVEEKSPWNISSKTVEIFRRIGNEIDRVLCRNTIGQFFSITFSAPHFRYPLLLKMFDQCKSRIKIKNIKSIGEDFHFFLYHLTNDLCLTESVPCFTYEPPIISKLENYDEHDQNEDDFLKEIKL